MQTAETPPREAASAPVAPRASRWRPRGGSFAVQLAVLSAGAGAVHLSVAAPHFDYYWLHGAFFVVAGLAQIVWAGLVLAYPTRPVFVLGALGNGAMLVTWGISRTMGVPFGPEPWVPEHIGLVDGIATAFEVLIVGAVIFRLRKPETQSPPRELALGKLAAFGAIVLALTAGGIVKEGIGGHVHGGLGELSLSAGGHTHAGSPIAPDDPLLIQLEDAVRSGGAIAGMDLLEQKAADSQDVQRLAHQYVHSLARFHYDLSPDPATAFQTCDDRFEGGCYHGVLQQYFEENSGINAQSVTNVCQELGAMDDLDLKWQCLHGLGHGLTLNFDHNLLRPLRYCDFLSVDWDRRACYGGVFMENVIWAQNVKGQEGTGEGVISEDLHYPCNAIADKYKPDCWLMQTSSILPLVQWDWARAFDACNQAEKAYIGLCYDSMGRDIAGYTVHDAEQSGSLCLSGAKKYQGACLSGAAKQLVDYHGATDPAFTMCAAAPDYAKQTCYQAMGEMVYFYWSEDPALMRQECAKAGDPEMVKVCEIFAQVRGSRVTPLE